MTINQQQAPASPPPAQIAEAQELKQLALAQIQTLDGAWTDHNVSDPGIAMLDALSLGMAELSQRLQLPIAQLLAEQRFSKEYQPLHSAEKVLPASPVTKNDWRILFLDLEGVANVTLNLAPTEASNTSQQRFDDTSSHCFANEFDEAVKPKAIAARGNVLYQVTVDLEPGLLAFENAGLSAEQKNAYESKREDEKAEFVADIVKNRTRKNVYRRFLDHRQSNQDISEIVIREQRAVTIELSLKLDAVDQPLLLIAQVLMQLRQQINPLMQWQDRQQLHNEGMGASAIYDGPLTQHGRLTVEQLAQQSPQEKIVTADVLASLENIDGLVAVTHLHYVNNNNNNNNSNNNNQSVRAFSLSTISWQYEPNEGVDDKGIQWVLDVEKTYENLLIELDGQSYPLPSWQVFKQGGEYSLPARRRPSAPTAIGADVMGQSTLQPNLQCLSEYQSIQQYFPACYKLLEKRLDQPASSEEWVGIMQLKGYLALYEQVLADQFKQLEAYTHLFSLPQWKNDQQQMTTIKAVFKAMLDSEDLLQGQVTDFWAAIKTLPHTQLSQSLTAITGINALVDYTKGEHAEGENGFQTLSETAFGFPQLNRLKRALEQRLAYYGETQLDAAVLKYAPVFRFYASQLSHADQALETDAEVLIEKLVLLKQIMDLRHLLIHYPDLSQNRTAAMDYSEDLSVIKKPMAQRSGLARRLMAFLGMEGAAMPLSMHNQEGFYLVESCLLRHREVLEALPTRPEDQYLGPPTLYFVFPDWPTRFANNRFKRLIEQELVKHCPLGQAVELVFLSRLAMGDFEQLHYAWLYEMSSLQAGGPQAKTEATDKYPYYQHPLNRLSRLMRDLLMPVLPTLETEAVADALTEDKSVGDNPTRRLFGWKPVASEGGDPHQSLYRERLDYLNGSEGKNIIFPSRIGIATLNGEYQIMKAGLAINLPGAVYRLGQASNMGAGDFKVGIPEPHQLPDKNSVLQ